MKLKRECEVLIQDLIKHLKNRRWIKSHIKLLMRIENKTPEQERALCMSFATLSWIPFNTEENQIYKHCRICDFYKYINE